MPLPALKHHIVLVSAQAMPTILGASIPGAEPSHIHAVVTPPMLAAAQLLESALHTLKPPRGMTVYPLDNSSSQAAIYSVLDAIREACKGESLGINLTGGTKLMALAAVEWADTYAIPTFYVDTAEEQIIQTDQTWSYAALPDVLTVHDVLTTNGYAVEACDTSPVPRGRHPFLRDMLELACAPAGADAIGRLNALATEASSQPAFRVREREYRDEHWEKILRTCTAAGMIRRGNGCIAFASENARRWCNGIWFEEYVKMILHHLKHQKQIHDWAASITVCKDCVKNEIDAAFCVRNRFFSIECKSGTMSTATSILYKADSLHDRLGGVFAKAMLCSIRPLNPGDSERAHDYRIRTVCGSALLHLPKILESWSKQR